jgi:tRNA threonylcarbamoyladenosine biosynthesis protein TsaE
VECAEFFSEGPEDTFALGRALARAALPLPGGGLVVALHGDLGAGKTVFVQGVAAGLGVPPSAEVVSPTFTIARSYRAPGDPGRTLHHMDAYRLLGAGDLEAVGFEDLCGDGALLCVEWAERVEEGLPPVRLEVTITPEGAAADPLRPPRRRRVRMRARGQSPARVLRALCEARVG